MTSETHHWFSSAHVVFITDTDAVRQDGTFVSGSTTQSKRLQGILCEMIGEPRQPLRHAIEDFRRGRKLAPAVRETDSIPRTEGVSSGVPGFICKNPLGSICNSPFEWVDSFPEWNRLWTSPSWTVPSGRTVSRGQSIPSRKVPAISLVHVSIDGGRIHCGRDRRWGRAIRNRESPPESL